MSTLRNLGVIDLTPQPCGHVGPHDRLADTKGYTTGWLGYLPSGKGERCEHWVVSLQPYRRRDHRSGPTRWWIECGGCDWDWSDYDEAACLAMFATHRENELTLAAAYLPENVEPPWKDAP